MRRIRPEIYCILLLLQLSGGLVFAQDTLHNYLSKNWSEDLDSLYLGEDFINLESVRVFSLSGDSISPSCFEIDPFQGKAYRLGNCPSNTWTIYYKTFGIKASRNSSLRDSSMIIQPLPGKEPSVFPETENPWEAFPGLESSGNITRGITAGSNQNIGLDARMNIQLSGNLNENTRINASIHDENLPGQSSGYTQQLQEFDRVSIGIENPVFTLTGGDYNLKSKPYELGTYEKRTAGIYLELHPDSTQWKAGLGGGISRGKYAINQFNGVEGNQGPYPLTGNANENFILIISGSERVFIDGKRLTRGENNDYVIDYNAAEIRFTPNQPITREKRISVEFQYTDKNYARFLTNLNLQGTYEKGSLEIDHLMETDAKNQPLQQDLNQDDKIRLSMAGDQNPSIPSDQLVDFNPDAIQYRKIDTLGYTNVLVFSKTFADSLFTASFRKVGDGKGDYIQVNNEVNGIVYRWVAPIGGVSQGNYEPERILIAPVKRSQLIIRHKHKFASGLNSEIELAQTQFDQNLFSNLDSKDDKANGVFVSIGRENQKGFHFQANLGHFENNFSPFEDRFEVEYNRDWNLNDSLVRRKMTFGSLGLGFKKDSLNQILSQTEFNLLDAQSGIRQNLSLSNHWGPNEIKGKASLLSSQGLKTGDFYRHEIEDKIQISQSFYLFGTSLYESKEVKAPRSDSLSPVSFRFHDYKIGFGQKADSSSWSLAFQNREDLIPLGNRLENQASIWAIHSTYSKTWERAELGHSLVYRSLSLQDSSQNLGSLTGRTSFKSGFFQNQLILNTRLEVSSGQEPERVFSYIEVQPGQGQYGWIDYNQNNIKEIDEFVVAPLQDTANFIRVFTPTNRYLPVNRGFASLNLSWNPRIRTSSPSFWRRFSNQFQASSDQRRIQEGSRYEQAFLNIPDSSLIGQNQQIQNQVYFNRGNSNFTSYLVLLRSAQKSLIGYGQERRSLEQIEWMGRKSLGSSTFLSLITSYSEQENQAGDFEARTFKLFNTSQRIDLEYRLSRHWLIFKTKYKHSKESLRGSLLDAYFFEIEYRIQSKQGGQASGSLGYVQNVFMGNPNSLAGFEMLEGLQVGENLTWGLGWNQLIGNSFQISIDYRGRKGNGNTIHTGTAKVRLIF